MNFGGCVLIYFFLIMTLVIINLSAISIIRNMVVILQLIQFPCKQVQLMGQLGQFCLRMGWGKPLVMITVKSLI